MTQVLRSSLRPSPDKIVVPRKRGQVLVEPGLTALATAVHSFPSIELTVFGPSVDAFRSMARVHLAGEAWRWAEMTGAPVPDESVIEDPSSKLFVLTGHQV